MSNTKNNNFSLKHFKNDFPASLVVWLVALPLCIGIAKGSEVNAFSGLIAGIIGGIIVTIFSGSKFGVSGSAVGLITIVVAGISTFNGNLEVFFLAVFLSGIIQFLLGLFRLGVIGYFVPTSVINGMLASIGLTLMLKQLPLIFGGFGGSATIMPYTVAICKQMVLKPHMNYIFSKDLVRYSSRYPVHFNGCTYYFCCISFNYVIMGTRFHEKRENYFSIFLGHLLQ